MTQHVAAPKLWGASKNRNSLDKVYYRVKPSVRMSYAAQYFGLAAFLSVMAFEIHDGLRV